MNRMEVTERIREMGADLVANADNYAANTEYVTNLYFDCDVHIDGSSAPTVTVHKETVSATFMERMNRM